MPESKKTKSTSKETPRNPGWVQGTYKIVTATYNPSEHYPKPSKNVKTKKSHSNTSHGGRKIKTMKKSMRKNKKGGRKNTRRR